MQQPALSPEFRALAQQSFQHQAAGRFAEAAQGYTAVLARVPGLWSACYNLGLVYQHLARLPEAAEMYTRAIQLNPELAQAYNNLGNVLKALKNDDGAFNAYRRAVELNSTLFEATYNLATILQARNQHSAANEMFSKTIAGDPNHLLAQDALFRSLLGLKRYEEAIEMFLAWDRAMPPCPELATAGLAVCRLIGDPVLEARYLALALDWPFADFVPDQFMPILGILQYFDITREQLLKCYRRYDAAIAAQNPVAVPLLPRRAADARLRIGYISADFRRHVMGRWMLAIISKHDRTRVSIFLVSTCAPREYDTFTERLRSFADGFADVSKLDDLAAAKSIAEADLDVLVDLAGHTMGARHGVYALRPARSIVTHLGYHGCLGMRAIDYKLTDRVADLPDAAHFQIERPFTLETCLFPFARVVPADNYPTPGGNADLDGKFVFAAFTNELKLSPRCLAVWRRVLDAIPEAVLLFSPLSVSQYAGIERILAVGGIDKLRIAFLKVPLEEAIWRARYRLVNAVLDTFPYAGGDTTLAALDMGVPVVTLTGLRQSERVGASILTHLGVTETIAATEDEFVAIAVRLARDAAFMTDTRKRIEAAVAATDVQIYTRGLEVAFATIAAEKPVASSMTMTAREFFQLLREGVRRHESATDDTERSAVVAIYAALRVEQPDYSPLLRVQGELAQTMGDTALAADCASALLRQFPDDLEVRLSSAGFLIDSGSPADAIQALPPVVDVDAGASDVRVLKLYTRAYAKMGQWETAHQFSAPAVELAPADTQALFWHGMVLSHFGDPALALTFLNRALILSPDHIEAAYNAGVILTETGNLGDAETVFRRALNAPVARATTTVRVSAHLRLLQLLSMQGRHDEWMREGQKFASAYPDQDRSRLIESRIARDRGELEREAEILLPLAEQATVLADDVSALELIGALLAILSYYDVPAQLLQRLHHRFRRAARVLYPPLDALPSADTNRQLQVGYLVDFFQPFVADFIGMLVGHHDLQRVRVRIYAVSPVEPAIHDALRAAGIELISVATFDEHRAAQIIRADDLDILVDVAGFGHYAKPGLLSRRPARVQLALPGFTNPVGIGDLDYRLSDQVAECDASLAADKPVPIFLDGGAFPLLPLPQSRSQLTRAQLGISADVAVFGVLAAAARLSSRCITGWKALADAVPDAVFFVCPLQAADREPVKRLLLAGGVDTARILMLPGSYARARDVTLTGLVDVILDTMPGSDYFSTRAAIHDAIPLVTMSGRMFEERVALSLLSHFGDQSTIAASGRDYVEIAAKLVQALNASPRARTARTDRQRDLLRQSPIADMRRYVTQFEEALFRAAASGAVADQAEMPS